MGISHSYNTFDAIRWHKMFDSFHLPEFSQYPIQLDYENYIRTLQIDDIHFTNMSRIFLSPYSPIETLI